MSKSVDEAKFLLSLDELKSSLSRSYVRMDSRYKIQQLLSIVDNSHNLLIAEDVKSSARQLLTDLQKFLRAVESAF